MPQRLFSSFSILIFFAVFIIAGVALAPLIPVQLKPDYTLPTVSVRYAWSGAQPRAIEQEVTSPLEGLFATMRGIKNVKSESGIGFGQINIEFDKNTDMELARFEVAASVRRVYPQLPPGVLYPQVVAGGQTNNDRPVLVYTIMADLPPQEILALAESRVKEKLAQTGGVSDVQVYGASPDQWDITYDFSRMQALGISANDIAAAINGIQKLSPVGMGKVTADGSEKGVVIKNGLNNHFDWEAIPIGQYAGRTVTLGEIASVELVPEPARSYFRINGKNTIYLAIYAQEGQNQVLLAGKIKQTVADITAQPGFPLSFVVNSDSSEFIKTEIEKNVWRMVATLVILFCFVWLASRNLRYVLLLFISLLVNICLSFLLYYAFGIELHLYSFAGFTISLGFLIDNSIVMIDHLRHKNNLKVFMALLASTLTTIAALCIVFFLDENTRLQLVDFSAVVIINLAVSLVVSLLFIPALMEKMPLAKSGRPGKKIRRKRRVVKVTYFYRHILRLMNRRKKLIFALAVLGFGLPVFMLPTRLGKEDVFSTRSKPETAPIPFYTRFYNNTLGSEFYNKNIRPIADASLGGALRLFVQKTNFNNYFAEKEQTRLRVDAQMPEGATLEQMNEVFVRLETYLRQFNEIDRFETRVYSSRNGSMDISFKKDFEFSGFPYMLMDLITSQAIAISDADWQVRGVGDGFNNSMREQTGSYKVTLQGYNYEELAQHAERLRDTLLVNPRIKEINIMGRDAWTRDFSHEFNATFNNELLALNNTPLSGISGFVNQLSREGEQYGRVFLNGKYNSIVLTAASAGQYDQWQFYNGVIGNTGRQVKLSDMGAVQKQRTAKTIYKNNQQYQLVLEYDFIGDYYLGNQILGETLEEFIPTLPIGYTAKENNRRYLSAEEKYEQVKLVLLVIALIYFICAILFNSLLQPLAVIFTIPISLIGVFLTYYLLDINFGQGGFAAIILLGGLTVNSAIYIVNEMNQLRARRNMPITLRLYLKAFNAKIIPVLLTILSTILGLIPFLADGQKEPFWFSLATGTAGGLLFSMVSIYIYLPLFFVKKENRKHNKNISDMTKTVFSTLIIACFIACSCGSGEKGAPTDAKETTTIADLKPMEVETMVVKRGAFSKEITSNGKIMARQKVELRFQSAAKIKRIYKANGDRVKKGDIIAELDNYEIKIKLSQLKARFEKARIDLADVLISQGFDIRDSTRMPKETLDIAKIRSGYVQASADYELAKYDFSTSVMESPINGVLANLQAKEMNYNKTSEAFCIVFGENIEAGFTVLESELTLIKKGQAVAVAPYFNQQTKVNGVITEINPMVDKNGLVYVKALLQGTHEGLFEGMNVKIIIKSAVDNKIVVPKSAVTTRSEKKVVFTYKKGMAMWNYVQIGLENSEGYTIEDVLETGDTVIVKGALHLGDMVPVVVKNRNKITKW
jgi:RND family efflux transporter MFP subunit